MTQFNILRRLAGVIRTVYRSLDSCPPPPRFDTYGTYSRVPRSFTHKLFLS
jgi:hypothetical protein